jgi:hypothetical protein
MKSLTLLLLTFLLGKSCSNVAQNDLDTAVIEYVATSRGFFHKVILTNKKMSISRDRDGIQPTEEIAISDTDWKELVHYFQTIHLEQLPNLKDPTQKRFYDGAAIATLKVHYQKNNYQTTEFDHGFPPAAIEQLVNKIVALSKQKE